MDRAVQIRDKLVLGLLDKEVCEKSQLKTDLILEKAKALHHELIKKQNEGASAQLDVVKFKKKERFKDQQSIKPTSAIGRNRTRTKESRSSEGSPVKVAESVEEAMRGEAFQHLGRNVTSVKRNKLSFWKDVQKQANTKSRGNCFINKLFHWIRRSIDSPLDHKH